MRIMLVIFSLSGGGAQRVISTMANYWAARGWHVTLVTYSQPNAKRVFWLHPQVHHRPLNIANDSSWIGDAIFRNISRILRLRRIIIATSPCVVISFIHRVNIRTVLATLGLRIPVIVSERIDPRANRIGFLWNTLRTITYRFATCVVTQSVDAMDCFAASIRRRGKVIPNPLSVRHTSPDISFERTNTVMGMGRLVYQKGFDLLLEAFALVAARHQRWSLVIWGDGELRGALEGLRRELRLEHCVRLPGWTDDPYGEMKRAGVFVLASRYEGFPNVLCEAMACGLPVVSFDCPSGPAHIIRNAIDGLIVPRDSVRELATAIDGLLGNPEARAALSAQAVEINQRFGLQNVMKLWEESIFQAISARGLTRHRWFSRRPRGTTTTL